MLNDILFLGYLVKCCCIFKRGFIPVYQFRVYEGAQPL